MAQTGYTPILIYSSSTVSQTPSASNLTNSTLGSELAINITDGKLFYKDNANAVQVIAWKVTPTTAGGTGLTTYSAGDLLYYATGTTLTKLAIGASGQWLGSSGTAPQWNAPAALTKTDDTNVTLTLGGSASTALLNAASLTLGWTGQLAVTRGGTGLSTIAQGDILYGSAANTLSALAKNTTATRYLSNTGASNNPAWAQVDLTNGVTGTLPVGSGGTGIATLAAGYIPYGNTTSPFSSSANLQYTSSQLRVGNPSGGYTVDVNGGLRQSGGATTKTGSTASLGAAGTEDVYTGGSFDSFYVIAHGNGNTTQWSAAIVYIQAGGGVNVSYINAGAIGIGSGGNYTIRLTNSATTQSIGYTIFYFTTAS